MDSDGSRRPAAPPRCVVVTGPCGAGKTRWLQDRIRALRVEQPEARFGVVIAEEGRTRWEKFVQETPGLAVRRVFLPCPCCPALADLPGTVNQLVAESGAAHLFLELPAVAAAGLLAEFDRTFGWPRQVVVCKSAAWADAERRGVFSPFYGGLLDLADTVIEPPTGPRGGR
jgi:Ni2+-binding GTPase involved in maturation of urease and hydrogenase